MKLDSAVLLRWLAALLVCLGVALLAIAGLQLARQHNGAALPASAPKVAQPAPTSLPPGAAIDALGRLSAWAGKTEVPCPSLDTPTAVIVVLGQGLAGNHAEPGNPRQPHERALNWYQGKCYPASSPLLGATGEGDEPWTRMADQLLASQQFKTVLIAPIAIAGSGMSRWVPGGDIDQHLVQDIRSLQAVFRTTHVIWLQSSTLASTTSTEKPYLQSMQGVIKTLRSVGVRAPIYLSAAHACGKAEQGENPLTMAQANLIDNAQLIFRGVDMDALLSPEDLAGPCYLSAKGVGVVASAWSQRLLQP